MDANRNLIAINMLKFESKLEKCIESNCKAEKELAKRITAPKAMALALNRTLPIEEKKRQMKQFLIDEVKAKHAVKLHKCHISKCEAEIVSHVKSVVSQFKTMKTENKKSSAALVQSGEALINAKPMTLKAYQTFTKRLLEFIL